MKVCGLVAVKDFVTSDASGKIQANKYDALPPLYYSTARRLIKCGYAVRKRTRLIVGGYKDA